MSTPQVQQQNPEVPFVCGEGWLLMEKMPLKSRSGIIVPEPEEDQRGKPDRPTIVAERYRIVAIGPGELTEFGARRSVVNQPGDVIIIGKPAYAMGFPIKLNGKVYVLAQSRFIVGTLSDPDAMTL